MDRIRNPYAPGAGSPPPELAGRDGVLEDTEIVLDRIRAGRHARDVLLVGLRGVGKTVLLNRVADRAEARGMICSRIEAQERRSLPALLTPALRLALVELDRIEAAREYLGRAWRVLAGFVRAAKLKYGDLELNIDAAPEPGLADTGELETDLQGLFRAVGEAARERNTAVALFVDELQYVDEPELAALIVALHVCRQRELPVALVGAGLPQLVGKTGKAKSYAERLFDFPEIGRLDRHAASRAIGAPAAREGVRFDAAALELILDRTEGYPYFLQEWGQHTWRVAKESPIGVADVERATEFALVRLDEGFFRVRYDRCTPSERDYLRAMARLGRGPHRSGDIAREMGREVTSVAPIRNNLIVKGMVYSPAHGDTAFTVPMFDGFMNRAADKRAGAGET